MTTRPDEDPAPGADALLAIYADDPRALSAAERAQVEALLDGDGDAAGALVADRATLAAVRGLGATGGPDWGALEASIQAATTRAPRGGRSWWIGGAVAVAALAAGLALALAGPRGSLRLPALSVLSTTTTAPAVGPDGPADDDASDDDASDDDASDDGAADSVAVDDDSDLGGMGEIDEALIDEVIELEAVADDDAAESDDLPAIGATWTAWLADFSDDDLDQAIRWLETQETT